MRPRRLTVEGFGAFRERTEIDFADADLVALVGPTGAGKSTIIDALTFALYGSVVRYDDSKLVAPVIHQLATEARVRLDFELHGAGHVATRVVRRRGAGATTPEARLERGDDVLADRARDVTQRVTELLGLDAEQFNKTVVLPQGRFAEFLHDTPGDRQATLRRLLGLGLYARLGQAARQRAATAKAHADAYADDVADGERQLSDERRAEVVDSLRSADGVAAQLERTLVELDELDHRLATADAEREVITAHEARLVARAPDGVAELARGRETAARDLARAEATATTARDDRRRAAEAAAGGPDLTASQLHLAAHEAHRLALEAVDASAAAGDERARELAEAEPGAESVRAERAELAQRAAEAEAAEQLAIDRRAALPPEAEVRDLLALHERQRDAEADTRRLELAAADADARLVTTTQARNDAAAAAERARDELTDCQLHAGAAGLAATLRVGAPCPVCRHVVTAPPPPPDDGALDDARRRAEATAGAAEAAAAAQAEARAAQARAAAELEHHRDQLAAGAVRLAAAPTDAELRITADAIEAATAAVARARDAVTSARAAVRRADTDEAARAALARAADAHRAWVAHEARHATLVERADAALADLGDRPDRNTAAAAVEQALELDRRRRTADATADAADAAERVARQALAACEDRLADARRELRRTRDRLADLDPPPIDADDDVASGWSALTTWVQARAEEAAARRAQIDLDHAGLVAQRHEVIGAARAAVRAVVPGAGGDRHALRDAVVRHQAACAAALVDFDRRRQELAALRERVAARRGDEAVARALGQLLSAQGFEGWVMAAALEDLAARATTRLHALSSGQFSLVVEDREFIVCDHRNADERRSIRTLSGGETFLASLALALALAEATAELAPPGAAPIESIFLDEGFGTLDPDTMDTVATAIEELGASGRMVVLVTHIRELADRMPVRIEVTKGPDTSRAERVEV